MNQSHEKAIEFLLNNINLKAVQLDEIAGSIYMREQYENCDIFIFELFEKPHIGSTMYIAVPKDSSVPFFIGELGE